MIQFTVDEDFVCILALQNLGIYAPGEIASSVDLDSCKVRLRDMLTQDFITKSLELVLAPMFGKKQDTVGRCGVEEIRMNVLSMVFSKYSGDGVVAEAREYMKFVMEG